MNEIRSFVATNLPAEIKEGLAAIEDKLALNRPWVKWVEPSGIHLTLKFLGNLDPERIREVLEILGDLCHGAGPFRLEVGGLGAFPGVSRPRVIWVGVGGELEKLAILQRNIDEGLSRVGFAPEDRAFTPHLTIGRVREGADPVLKRELGREIEGSGSPFFGSFVVSSISLMRSQLTPKGAVYSELGSFLLGACQGEGV